MKSALAILVVLLAAAALAQAGPALDGDRSGTALTPVSTGLANKAQCYLSVVWRMVTFVADIPRNCLDLAWRSQGQFLYVLPACVVYSAAATYEIAVLSFPNCASA